MKVGSLFSGIGGLYLGLERAGMEVIWQVENDPYCLKVLAKHWPNVKRYGDIKEIDWSEVEPVDLICGGFPCQPVSYAGKRLAQSDERWLWPEVDRCIRALRPRFVLVENVPGLLSAGMSDVLGDLAAGGYDAEWDCIPASFLGAPHRRERLYLVAYTHEVNGAEGMGHFIHGPSQIFRGAVRVRFDLWLQAASRFVGMGNGLSRGVYRHRVGALGNAVVPQVAEWIGRRILESEAVPI